MAIINGDELDFDNVQDPEIIRGDDLDFERAVMGKPRPAPPRPKPKPKKNPRQPVKVRPIPITDEMRDATVAMVEQEYARRLLKEQQSQEADQTRLNTLSVFQPMAPGMGEFRTASQEDLNIRVAETQRQMKDVLKSGKKRAIRRAAQGKRITPVEEYLIQQPEEMDLPPMPDTTIRPSGRLSSDLAAYFEPVAQMVPMTIEGLVEVMDMMTQGTPGASKKGLMGQFVEPVTQSTSSFLRGAMPVDPQYQETELLQAFGSATGFIGGGLAGRAVRIPPMVTTALLGAGVSVADAMREADFNNVDPKRRDAALILAAVSGLTEMAGVGRMVNSLGLKRQFYKRMFEVAEEGGQEALQTWLGNVNAAYVGNWDPTRPLDKDVMKNALLGAIVGGGVQGVSWAREKMKTPKPLSPLSGNKFLEQGGPARIPPPQGYQSPMPPNRLRPMGDMAMMSKKEEDPLPIEVFADRLRKEGIDPGDISQYKDATDLYLTMLGSFGPSGMNERQQLISKLFHPEPTQSSALEVEARRLAEVDGIDWDQHPEFHYHYFNEADKQGPKVTAKDAIKNKLNEIALKLGMGAGYEGLHPREQYSLTDDYHLLNSFLQGGRNIGQEDADLYADLIKKAQTLHKQDPKAIHPVTGEQGTVPWEEVDYDDRLQYFDEAIRIHNLKPGPPKSQVTPQLRDTVKDSNEREDNLLEWLKESQAFHATGDPIIGINPSTYPTEHTIVDPENTWNVGAYYGFGMDLYQDPEAVEFFDPNQQDYRDHPDFQKMYEQKLQFAVGDWTREQLAKPYSPFSMDRRIPPWIMSNLETKAQMDTIDTLRHRFRMANQTSLYEKDKEEAKFSESSNLRPYYINMKNPFKIHEGFYGAEVIPPIREAIRKKFLAQAVNDTEREAANWRADDALRIIEDEILDGAEMGITGEDLYNAIGIEIGGNLHPDMGTLNNESQVNRILKDAGFDGLTFYTGLKMKPPQVKEFYTLEEAQAHADKVGGIVNEQPGLEIVPEEVKWNWQTGQNEIVTPAKLSKGPTVWGSRVWKVWDGTQIKSTTGNTGEYNQNRPEVYRSRKDLIVPRGQEVNDDFAFDVMPALSSDYGRAPYMRAPQWFFDAIGRSDDGGINYTTDYLDDLALDIIQKAPSQQHADIALDALYDLNRQVKAEGLRSLSFINTTGTRRKMHRGIIEHEVSHAAQREGLNPDIDWARKHPLVNAVLGRKMYTVGPDTVRDTFFDHLTDEEVHVYAANEMVSYWIQDQSGRLKMKESEGRQFFKDYINHLRAIHGQAGVDKFLSVVRMRPEAAAVVTESNEEWGEWMGRTAPSSIFATPEGPYAARGGKKNIFQKILGAFVKRNKEILTENPPAPTIPPDEPIGTPPPRPPPPRDLRVEGPLGPLRKEHVTPEYTQLVTRTFTKMLEQGGIPVDPLAGAPFHQVAAALRAGQLQDVDIEGILQEEGVPWEQFATEMEETASDSGKVLQAYSEITKFWNEILDEYEGLDIEGFDVKPGKDKKGKKGKTITGPSVDQGKALLRIVPIQFRVKRILRNVRATALGKSLWQRMGNTTQKAMLTQFSTFTINTATTASQLPFRTLIGGMGAWMYRMEEGGSFQEANRDMLEAMRASMEVAVAMHPRQLVQLFQGQKNSTKYMEYWHIVNQLEKEFPDLHRKLFALGSGTETLKKGARELSIAQALAGRIPLNNPMREDILKELDTYEKRLDYNTSSLGKMLNAPEAVYDALLLPMQWSEYFLRRPMFVGQLNLELSREGLNLYQLMATNQLDTIPPEVIERAVNKALEFTYAYMPGTKTGTNYIMEQQVEKAAAGMIKWLNENGGPLGALFGEPFAKAMFNGAKFVYEWSPIGGILPYARIGGNLGRKEAIRDFNQARQQLGPNAQMKMKGIGIYTTPEGVAKLKNPTTQQDFDRLAKAMLGTMMYGIVATLRMTLGGDEWWQFDLGEKDETGRTVYTDIRRYKPISTMFQLYDLVERIATNRLGDIDLHRAITEVMTGIRLYDNQMGNGIIASMVDYFRDEPERTWKTGVMKGEEEIGKVMAVYITPMLNVRDLFAQFMEEENRKKDTRGETVLGPVMDRIPFVRRLLPDLTSPVEPSPIKLSLNPGLTQTVGFGYKEVPAQNFAGREWARLGIYHKNFIQRDADPKINRAMNTAFQNAVGQLAAAFEKDPSYLNATDKQKKMMWELFIGGEEGFAAMSRQIGEMANPQEALRRSMERSSGMGRFTKEATGFDEMMKKAFPDQ